MKVTFITVLALSLMYGLLKTNLVISRYEALYTVIIRSCRLLSSVISYILLYAQVKCLEISKPRCLSLNALDWEDSQVVRPFKDCGLADGFMKVWKLKFQCNINQQTGEYNSKNGNRKASTSTPTALLPASKRARLQEETTSLDDSSAFNESEMDETIKDHFLGT